MVSTGDYLCQRGVGGIYIIILYKYLCVNDLCNIIGIM